LVKALQIIYQEKPRVIFTTSPPHSAHLTGWLLRQLTGIKWVADFRDDWTGGESQPCPTPIHRLLNRFLEKLVLTTSDAVIGICDHLTRNLQRKSGLIKVLGGQKKNKFFTLTNGYDPEDFKGLNQIPREEKFTITHCGSVSRVSDPEPFLAALASLLTEAPGLKETLRVRFIGTDIFGRLAQLIPKYDLTDCVEVTGYLPHFEALRLLVRAHLLLLIVVKRTQEEVMTGKVFEYLASGTPVLAILPEGELAQLIRTTHRGTTVSHDNIEDIKKAIRNYYELFLQRQLWLEAPEPLSQFDRKNLTRKLAEIFELVARE
ncbi:MAG: glycosyltransferase, partial [candidate division KSB1 bacterium]|nr:glycosyltransferase [candidate division KSB1 bacterium]